MVFLLLALLSTWRPTKCTKAIDQWSTIKPIVDSMTLSQKIGQMIQSNVKQVMTNSTINPDLLFRYQLGSVAASPGSAPDRQGHINGDRFNVEQIKNGTLENWQDLSSRLNVPTIVEDYQIYPLLGRYEFHGEMSIVGQVMFLHNIGMAATHNATNFYNLGKSTSDSFRASGWNFPYAPNVGVAHNLYGGRYQEIMGSEMNIRAYSSNYTAAITQDDANGRWNGALAGLMFFLGNGATEWGIEKGNASVSNWNSFLERNYHGFAGGKDVCMGAVMAGENGINDILMSIDAPLLTGILKDGIKDGVPFEGFVFSAYGAINDVATSYQPTTSLNTNSVYYAIVKMINAGVDMFYLAETHPNISIDDFLDTVTREIQDGGITVDRINDAVTRILGVKCIMGLIDGVEGCAKAAPKQPHNMVESRENALTADKQSLVLLKDDNKTLPGDLSKYKYIVLAGERDINEMYETSTNLTTYTDYNNTGTQCGGYSLAWMGYMGNEFWQIDNKVSSGAMTILDSILNRVSSDTTVYYNSYADNTNMDEVKKALDKPSRQTQVPRLT